MVTSLFWDARPYSRCASSVHDLLKCINCGADGTLEEQSCSVHGAFKNKVWPFVAERVIPLKELRWSLVMLTSPRTVRGISRSLIVAEQGRLIAFSNVPPERSAEPLTLRHISWPWTSFRLGRVFSSLGACPGRKRRAAAPIASPGVGLCSLPGFASSQGTGGRRAKSWARAGYKLVLSALLATIALFTASTVSTHAQVTNWTGTQSTDWFTAGNWTAGVPTNTPPPGRVSTLTPSCKIQRLRERAHRPSMLTLVRSQQECSLSKTAGH